LRLGVIRKQVQRGRNALRRLRSGLPLYAAENVSPEVRNDLFQAHLSIYWFFARFVEGRRVLDIGCGTGYGTAHLRRTGAREVVGIDQDRRAMAYARSRYVVPGLQFLLADAEEFPAALGVFDLIVSSNVFEHLQDPARALDHVRQHLQPGGQFILVVPPIVDAASLAANRKIPFHKSNLFVWEWVALLGQFFSQVRAFRHLPPPGSHPDFTDPLPSSLAPGDFQFLEVPSAELGSTFTLGAVFVCSERLE
jgi:SAM-dependent methyltransferase